MKAIYKSLLAALAVTPLLTGCIEEYQPTNAITADQLEESPRATEALVWAIPGHLNQVGTISSSHWDIGYPGFMKIRDLFTADYHTCNLGANYNHFWYWDEVSMGMGPNYLYPQYPWNWFYEHVLIANKVIAAIDENTTNAALKAQLVEGLGARAWGYLDFARMYQTMPTDGYAVSDELKGLTLVKVTEETTEDMLRNNPRMTHEETVAFIKSDLDKAIKVSEGANGRPAKTWVDLSVIYGLYARLCLWDATYQEEINSDATAAAAQYAEAKRYAELAIATSNGVPLTQDEWLDTSKGFNDSGFSSWMFCGQYVTEDTGVQAPNVGWTGWTATEHTYGYSSTRLQAFPEIGADVYERMNDRDFRKLSFVAPEGSTLSGREPFIDDELAATYFTVPYINIKFRPGGAATTDNQVGCAVAYPLMRVEEMYFIAIEAAAHINAADGVKALVDFMTKYRYPTYKCNVTSTEDVVEEIVFQKRVELWGEGQAYFDLKRLGYPVRRAYEGTNFDWGAQTYNTNGRPAWYNFCITNQELNNNKGIPQELNAPTPAGRYTALTKL